MLVCKVDDGLCGVGCCEFVCWDFVPIHQNNVWCAVEHISRDGHSAESRCVRFSFEHYLDVLLAWLQVLIRRR